ncbi:hypothetical protein M407DRAFT_26917 [Tulasnella calospora MUT 4182]|uniref:Uncharacterized protein n=1 Tax=Tulasnella calospora MUT 4182 TaxID=1051891 RepID=A0A0C3Q448_9AGAM|nr:hypothetical protein M407DRAFT_26917 [Tulasnella calospora MUT 4182]
MAAPRVFVTAGNTELKGEDSDRYHRHEGAQLPPSTVRRSTNAYSNKPGTSTTITQAAFAILQRNVVKSEYDVIPP